MLTHVSPTPVPDFRSPGTGLYNNLARLNLPHPEAVFDIGFFVENPEPFYVLAKELYPGNFSPTISHVFIALLARKGLLRMLFTQNIDCLERAAGVPGDLIIEAHGSFATQRCVECKTPYPDAAMREHVARGEPARCVNAGRTDSENERENGCDGLVKPDIVFFGEQLPAAFFRNHDVPAEADLMLVLGTSLSVQPFASLPRVAPDEAPRVLFNLQRVGDLGTRPDDVLHLGDCDSGVRALADELGWREELEAAWEEIVGKEEADRQRARNAQAATRDSDLEDEVDDIASEVENKLKLDSPTPSSPPLSPPPIPATHPPSSSSPPPPPPLQSKQPGPDLEKSDREPRGNTTETVTDHHHDLQQERQQHGVAGADATGSTDETPSDHDKGGGQADAPNAPPRPTPGDAPLGGSGGAPPGD